MKDQGGEMDNIWIYWQNKKNKRTPDYISLCHESIIKHCKKSFKINILNDSNVKEYLPNIREDFFQISQINNKSNYLRYKLLYEFGGTWLDSDLILMQDLKLLKDNLLKDNTVDLIATASPEYEYKEPESGFLMSTKLGTTIGRALDIIENKLNNHHPGHIFPWGSMGPSVIREAVQEIKYLHLNPLVMMPIGWQEANRFLTNEPIDKTYNSQIFGYMLYNEMFRRAGHRIFDMTRNEILNSDMLVSQIIRKSLNE